LAAHWESRPWIAGSGGSSSAPAVVRLEVDDVIRPRLLFCCPSSTRRTTDRAAGRIAIHRFTGRCDMDQNARR
ncbi:hypothetical protein, partial [Longimicrobium sp.]|uniref:hypothetical protein n=1 Tax=Longimicrobium sp. TaxID=2029185 RepID=UPI002E37129E